MMRWWWRTFVPGRALECIWWAAWSALQFRHGGYFWAVLNCVMTLLNLWSWDYQRRHTTKS